MSIDYFSNHPRAARFPWSIYHRPLERSLARFLGEVTAERASPQVLVVGGGFLHELPLVPRSARLTVIDIDARVVERLAGLSDPRLVRCATVGDGFDLAQLGTFDAIYAKEVIEHVLEPVPWLRELVARLAPGGRMWVSTPNYGDFLLPLLESTVLELVARRSGYSRKHIHPTRFSRGRLAATLAQAGLTEVEVARTPLRLALVATARRAEAGSPRPLTDPAGAPRPGGCPGSIRPDGSRGRPS